MKYLLRTLLLSGLMVTLLVHQADGAGFGIFDQGARAFAMAQAFTALADDPSAIFYNPAGISQLEGTEVYVGTTIIAPVVEYSADPGSRSSDEEDNIFFPSYFYVTHRVNNKLTTGFGVFSPFGLVAEWPDDWEGRYISTRSEIKTFFLNPVISYQITSSISVAAGFDYVYSDLEMKKKIEFPDGEVKMDGTGSGIGYNLGLLYHITDTANFGITYRSAVDIDYDGNADFTLNILDGAITSNIKLPPRLTVGIATTTIKDWIFTFDIAWTGWSTIDELVVDFEKNAPPTETTPLRWNDVFSYHFGMEYQLLKSLKLRSGYYFDTTPMPGDTYTPLIPGGNRHGLSVGAGYTRGNFNTELTYGVLFFEEARKSNDIGGGRANGAYSTFVNLLGINLSYRF
ncbi:MAG: OmpP1/FadL family transporter [Nitrospinota bacterium]